MQINMCLQPKYLHCFVIEMLPRPILKISHRMLDFLVYMFIITCHSLRRWRLIEYNLMFGILDQNKIPCLALASLSKVETPYLRFFFSVIKLKTIIYLLTNTYFTSLDYLSKLSWRKPKKTIKFSQENRAFWIRYSGNILKNIFFMLLPYLLIIVTKDFICILVSGHITLFLLVCNSICYCSTYYYFMLDLPNYRDFLCEVKWRVPNKLLFTTYRVECTAISPRVLSVW